MIQETSPIHEDQLKVKKFRERRYTNEKINNYKDQEKYKRVPPILSLSKSKENRRNNNISLIVSPKKELTNS